MQKRLSLMKGDKVVELLEKSSDMFFLIKLPRNKAVKRAMLKPT